jgi:mannosyltransferase OCH1-like enzyme
LYRVNNKIPNKIYQTFESTIVDKSMSQCVQGWLTLNQDYDYYYFTSADRRDFILKYFGGVVLAAYDTLNPGAFKADLWRLCILYQWGGVYCDIKLLPNAKLNNIIEADNDIVLVIDNKCPLKKDYKDIYNAFMAFIPKHPFVKKLIDGIVKNVENRYYGHHCLTITGPKFIGKLLLEEINDSNFKLKSGTYDLPGLGNVKFLCHKFDLSIMDGVIKDSNNDIVIYRRNIHIKDGNSRGANYKASTGKSRYEVQFSLGKVYYEM